MFFLFTGLLNLKGAAVVHRMDNEACELHQPNTRGVGKASVFWKKHTANLLTQSCSSPNQHISPEVECRCTLHARKSFWCSCTEPKCPILSPLNLFILPQPHGLTQPRQMSSLITCRHTGTHYSTSPPAKIMEDVTLRVIITHNYLW